MMMDSPKKEETQPRDKKIAPQGAAATGRAKQRYWRMSGHHFTPF
jgi:hypothetical protein